LCWLALLLIRNAETTTGSTWNKIADELDMLTLGTFTGPAGTFRQTAELTKAQRGLPAHRSPTWKPSSPPAWLPMAATMSTAEIFS